MKFILLLLMSFSLNAQTIQEVSPGEMISASKYNELVQKLNQKIEGHASFRGSTVGSDYNLVPCIREREFGELSDQII